LREESTSYVALDPEGASFAARGLVREACETWTQDEADTAQLLVTELVANALVHGRGDIGLVVRRTAEVLRVEVTDGDPARPRIVDPAPSPLDESGRGLYIVDQLASSWGSLSDGPSSGKTVWFELRREAHG
jgi:anti-sigma regulatory factor (Ser/Thr protein kinase)